MITLRADFTNGFPASPFAGSVASAVQLGNAAAVPGTRKVEPRIAPETIRYATFRIFSSIFTVSFGAPEAPHLRRRSPTGLAAVLTPLTSALRLSKDRLCCHTFLLLVNEGASRRGPRVGPPIPFLCFLAVRWPGRISAAGARSLGTRRHRSRYDRE